MQTRWIAGWLAVAMCGAQGVAKQQTLEQPQPVKLHAVLVELFTSEGCSSCPPADDLLRRVDGKKTDQGALIVGISEHVTYWDHDGWKDPYGSETITDRQSEYSRRFHLESVYTPQMVVDGEAQFVGSDARSLAQAIRKVQGETETTLQLRSVTVDGGWVAAQVSVGTMPSKGADVFAVVAEDETTQHVLRGENEGKTLAHASVARVMVRIAQLRTGETTALRVKLPDDTSMPRSAKRHLIVWAQEPNFGRVLGTDTQAF